MVVVKIAVSIPDDVFDAAEREVRRRGTSRSALYADALRALVGSRTAIDEAIRDGYRRVPQDNDIELEHLPSMHDDLGDYPQP